MRNFRCVEEARFCDKLRNEIETTFAKKLMPTDNWFWDQPSAYRFLAGMLEAAVKYPADLSFFEVSSKSVNIFLNCRPDSIADIYSKTPMTAD